MCLDADLRDPGTEVFSFGGKVPAPISQRRPAGNAGTKRFGRCMA